jgi:hypothetical protein
MSQPPTTAGPPRTVITPLRAATGRGPDSRINALPALPSRETAIEQDESEINAGALARQSAFLERLASMWGSTDELNDVRGAAREGRPIDTAAPMGSAAGGVATYHNLPE